jgi:hypothetical protein
VLIVVLPLGSEVSAKQARAQQEGPAQELSPQLSSSGKIQKTGSGRTPQPATLPPESPPPENAPVGSTLDKLAASIKQIESSLPTKISRTSVSK